MLNQTQQESEHSTPPAIVQYEYSPPLESAIAPFPKAHVLTRDEMVSLQKRLVTKNKMVSGPAEQELAQMDATALTAFLAFERENRKRKIKCAAIVFVSAYGIMLTVSILTHQGGMFGTIGAFTGVMAGAAAFSNAYKSGVIALTRLENTDSIGELVSALEIKDKEVQKVVRAALIRMLPTVRATDAKLLSDESRQTLQRFLKGKFSGNAARGYDFETDARLRIATLNALCQIGDSSFIDIVEKLAKGEGNWPFRLNAEIVAAAKECLPYLNQRKLDAVASNELVRASNANSVGSADTLLRPVVGTQDMHEPELLRAAKE